MSVSKQVIGWESKEVPEMLYTPESFVQDVDIWWEEMIWIIDDLHRLIMPCYYYYKTVHSLAQTNRNIKHGEKATDFIIVYQMYNMCVPTVKYIWRIYFRLEKCKGHFKPFKKNCFSPDFFI